MLEEAVANTLREVVQRALRMSRESLTAWAADHWWLFRPIAMLGREGLSKPTERSTRVLAVYLAGIVWDHVPRPDNGFQPVVTSNAGGVTSWTGPDPGRNEPCPCGSGRKYKKCCMEVRSTLLQAVDREWLEVFEANATEIAADFVLKELGNREVLEAAEGGPLWLALAAARELLDRHKPKLATRALKDRMDAAKPMDHEMGEAVALLLRAYGACGWNRKAEALARQVVEHHADDQKIIATIATFLLGRMQRGHQDALRSALEFEEMVPRSAIFRVVGVVARLMEERWDEARRAAQKALEALRFQRDDLAEEYRSFLEETREDPERAFRHHLLQTNLNRSAFEQVVEFSKWLAEIAVDDDVEVPSGMVVPVEEGEMRFARESIIGQALWDRIDLTEDHDDAGEEQLFRLLDLARENPFDLGVLEALLELLEDFGEDIEFLTFVACLIAARVAPEEVNLGEVRLEWKWLENRPYLRLLARRMMLCHEREEIEDALDDAETLLALDPGDSQGIRGEAVGMALQMEDPQAALEILELFPEEDILAAPIYGRALALFMLGEEAAATEVLDRAIAGRPLVARRILNPDLPEPRLSSFGVAVGGEDEAFAYHLKWGFLWSADPQIKEWLRQRYRQSRSGQG